MQQLQKLHCWHIVSNAQKDDFYGSLKNLPSFAVPVKKFHIHMIDPMWMYQEISSQTLCSADTVLLKRVSKKRSYAKKLLSGHLSRFRKKFAKKLYSVHTLPNTCAIFEWPIARSNFWLSSRFGPRRKEDGSWGFHYAIDLAAPKGTLVTSAGDGKVIEAGYSPKGYGKTVLINHNGTGYQTRYAHLQKIVVKVGQIVAMGECIGYVGDTGYVRGENGGRNASHLHLEVRYKGKYIDPLMVLG